MKDPNNEATHTPRSHFDDIYCAHRKCDEIKDHNKKIWMVK